jgi:hypothetical protein
MALKQVEDVYNNLTPAEREARYGARIMKYKNPVCRGSWALGTACGHCERCQETSPSKKDTAPKPSIDEIERVAKWCGVMGLELMALREGDMLLTARLDQEGE